MQPQDFKNLFLNKMQERYFAMQVLNSGNIESKIDQKHELPVTAIAWLLDFIPKFGNKIADLFESQFKKHTVNKRYKNAQTNLECKDLDQFKVYATILLELLVLRGDFSYDLVNCRHCKSFANKFFEFASQNKQIDQWQKDSALKSALANLVESNQLTHERASFILMGVDFINGLILERDGFDKKHKLSIFFHSDNLEAVELEDSVVIENLKALSEIKTPQEINRQKSLENQKEIEAIKERSNSQVQAICTMLQGASICQFDVCMTKITAAAA